jgi:NAD(P)-dependent dehydrogenase (short-subunit alcohol dehydrogenase family)
MNPVSLADQRAVITGAGRGLGRAYALDLARRGASVVVNDFDRGNADAVVSEIVAAGGRAVASYEAVSSKRAGQAIVDLALSAFGGLEVVINNAGILRPGYFENLSEREINEVLDIHLDGTIYVTQAAWPHLQAQNYGRVVLTSSSTGMFGNHGQANYAAAKGGVWGLGRALAYEGQAHNIQVNVLLPYAATVIHKDDPIPDIVEEYAKFVTPDLRKRLDAVNHDPAMTAHLVTYLASRECTTTAEAFSVCYGRYARVFLSVADGWLSHAGDAVTAETIRDHWDQIRDIGPHSTPQWLFEEVADVARRL